MENSINIEKYIQDFSRGLVHNNRTIALEGYRALYQTGDAAIPHIKKLIFRFDWEKPTSGESTRFFVGFISLLQDINAVEANQVITQVVDNGCPDHIKIQLRSISQFSISNFKQYSLSNTNIYESKKLDASFRIGYWIGKWIKNIPEKDLKEISRIYIVEPDALSSLGTYTPVLCKVAISWEMPESKFNLFQKVCLFFIEHTFYHEIGHHFHRHTFGQDSQQEKEADAYSFKILFRTHPILGRVVRLIITAAIENTKILPLNGHYLKHRGSKRWHV